MPNKNYRRGFDAEDRCLKEMLAAGYWAERFHASKGTFDVIAVNENAARLIQVKRSKKWIKSVKAIMQAYSKDLVCMNLVPWNPKAIIELWVWFDKQGKAGEDKYRVAGWRKFLIGKGELIEVPA